MGNCSKNSGEESSTDCKAKVHLAGHISLGRWKTTPSSLQGIYHGRSHQLHQSYTWAFLNRIVTSPATKKWHFSSRFALSMESIIIWINQILWTSWIPTPPKKRRKSAVPLTTLIYIFAFPGTMNFGTKHVDSSSPGQRFNQEMHDAYQ